MFDTVTPLSIGSDSYQDDTRTVVVASFDGFQAFLTGNAGQANKMYRVPASTADVPSIISSNIGSETYETVSLVVGEFDDNSNLDVVITNVDRSLIAYTNPGTSTFSDVSPLVVGATATPGVSIGLGDLDSNGFLDVLVGNQLYLNPGDGDLFEVDPVSFSLLDEAVNCVGVADLDNDVTPWQTRQTCTHKQLCALRPTWYVLLTCVSLCVAG